MAPPAAAIAARKNGLACGVSWRAQAGTGCHEGGIILSKKPPEWHLSLPLPVADFWSSFPPLPVARFWCSLPPLPVAVLWCSLLPLPVVLLQAVTKVTR